MRRSLTRREVLKLGGGALAGAYTFALAGCSAHGGGGSQSPQARRITRSRPSTGPSRSVLAEATTSCPAPLIEILNKYDLYSENIVATNMEGGDGARGWGFLYNQKGNPYHISYHERQLHDHPARGRYALGTHELYPHRHARNRRHALHRKEDSPYDSMEEFVAAAKEKSLPIGGIATINIDFIMAELLSQQAGFELKYVAFNDEGEMISALLSKALDMIASNPAEVLGLVESGDAKALAFSGKAAHAQSARRSDP